MNRIVTTHLNDRMLLPKALFVFVALSLLIIIGMCLVSFLAIWGVFDSPDVIPIRFESTAWKRADPIENSRTVRSQMIDDLIRRRVLDGLTRTEVENLLGPPSTTIGIELKQGQVVYVLGLERLGNWSLDYEYLVIWFNDSDRVGRYWKQVD